MPPLTNAPWAKLDRREDGTLRAALPLVDHCLDVGAAMEALLAGGAWAAALEATAARAVTAQDRARLVALAALHDVGKANAGFQARARQGTPRIGHTGQVAALLGDPQLKETETGKALAALIGEWGALSHVAALMAHHGRPLDEFRKVEPHRPKPWQPHIEHWLPHDGYDPAVEAGRVIAAIRTRWPLAWEAGERLPGTPRFVALFAGLVTLADWLGSDTHRFPIAAPHGPDREALRRQSASEAVAARGLTPLVTPPTDFAVAFDLASPRGVQHDAVVHDLGQVALIEAETGSGKTEAALWRWLELHRRGLVDGLYFALPTRSAAVQLHARVNKMVGRVWGEDAPEAVLAVPGYLRAGDATGEALPGFEVRWDDLSPGDDRRWAAERTNRYLAARVAVGTIDQALLGALQVKHAHLRAAALARSLLVVDEVHASDAYMGSLLERLLQNHVAAGGHALLLSATLGGTARARLLGQPEPSLAEAVAEPYPAIAGTDAPLRPATPDASRAKPVRIEVAPIIADPQAIAARAIEAARAGASVLVIRNSVAGAVAVAQAVEAIDPDLAFRVKGASTLHHGRFAPSDRQLLDLAVEDAFGKGRTAAGRVLVGTQTLEQSLDIDADLLLTDLAPMDVLLQRIGRLHRHPRNDRGAFAEARAIVLRPGARDLSPLLTRYAHGLGPVKDNAGAYPNLLHAEATLRLLEERPYVTIPADNRFLVEHALHPEQLDAIAAELGTSWRNHLNAMKTAVHASRGMARGRALDLAIPFRELVFPVDEAVTTRLGDQPLIVDLGTPFTGPFGDPVDRLAIPHWWTGGIGRDDYPQLARGDEQGQHLQIGTRQFVYGRWGLAQTPA